VYNVLITKSDITYDTTSVITAAYVPVLFGL